MSPPFYRLQVSRTGYHMVGDFAYALGMLLALLFVGWWFLAGLWKRSTNLSRISRGLVVA